MGADPIASAAISDPAGRDLLAFFVRKEKKQHGLQRWVEGPLLEAGTPVLIVEDVVTTGGSTVKAIERCLEEGLRDRRHRRLSSTAWPEAPRQSRPPAARLIRRLQRSTTSTRRSNTGRRLGTGPSVHDFPSSSTQRSGKADAKRSISPRGDLRRELFGQHL